MTAAMMTPPVRSFAELAPLAPELVVVFGAFALLGLPGAGSWAVPLLLVGLGAGAYGLHRAGDDLATSRYRPDPWGAPEYLVICCGLTTAAVAIWLVSTDPAMAFGAFPLTWPQLSWPMLLAAAVAALPGLLTPEPPKDAA